MPYAQPRSFVRGVFSGPPRPCNGLGCRHPLIGHIRPSALAVIAHTHTLRLLPPSGPASSCPAWSHSASKQKPCSALKISALCAPNNYLSLRPLFRRRRRRRGAPSSSRRHHVCCRPVTRPVSNAPRGAFRRLRLYLAGFVDLSLGKSLPRTLLRHSQLRASACRGHAAPPYTCPRPCYTRCYS